MPRGLFRRAEQRWLPQQRPHAVGADFGRRMQPAEGAHPRKVARQHMLQKAADQLERFELDGGRPAGFARAIVPPHFAFGQEGKLPIGGGGLEHVTGEVTQGVLTRTGGLAADVPMLFPNLGGDLAPQVGRLLLQPLLEHVAETIPEGLVVEQERSARRHPAASVRAEAAAGDEVVHVRMIDQRAAPGVQHAEHAELRAQPQAAGVNEAQTNAMVQGRHPGQNAAHFGGREHDRQFELGIGAGQLEFVGPDAFEGLLPEELEGADDLGGSLAGDLLFGLEMDAVLAELLGRNQVGRFGIELTELTEAGKIGLFGAGADGQELEVVGEGI